MRHGRAERKKVAMRWACLYGGSKKTGLCGTCEAVGGLSTDRQEGQPHGREGMECPASLRGKVEEETKGKAKGTYTTS